MESTRSSTRVKLARVNRVTFWFDQLVNEASLNKLSTNAETAERALYADNLPAGVSTGMSVAAQSSPNMTVNVTAGTARSATGERISIPSTQIVNIALDSDGVTTTVAGGSSSKIVSVFVEFARNNQTPYVDGNSVSGYEDNLESFAIKVIQGAESSGTPTPPALTSGRILLADITLVHGQTTVTNSDIDLTDRRQDAFVVTGTTVDNPHQLRAGTSLKALADLLSLVNGHFKGSADKHDAEDINYAGSGTWYGSITGLAGSSNVETALDTVVSQLAGASSNSGAERVGSKTVTCPVSGVTLTVAASSVHGHLTALTDSANIGKAAYGSTWADGTAVAADNLSAYLDTLIGTLGSQIASSGARKIGFYNVGNFVASNVQAALAKLTSTTNGADGANVIGFYGAGSANAMSATDVGAALYELDSEKGSKAVANTWTAAQTFDNITTSSGNHYKLAAATSVQRVDRSPFYNNAYVAQGFTNVLLAATVGNLLQFLRLPHGSTLTRIDVRLPVQASRSPDALPATKPAITLYKINQVTGVGTGVVSGPVSDTSATNTDYKTAHDLSITGLSEVIDNTTYSYYIAVTGEAGANAQDVRINPARWTVTVPNLDEGAC